MRRRPAPEPGRARHLKKGSGDISDNVPDMRQQLRSLDRHLYKNSVPQHSLDMRRMYN